MATALTLGRKENKDKIPGGLKAIYVVGFLATLKSGATLDSNDQITAFASAQTLLKYELKGTNNSLDENGVESRDNGSLFYEQSGSVVLKSQDLATRKELHIMSKERVHIITEDNNNLFKIYGFENGCEIAVATSNGAAMGDLSGYTITITGTESDPANFIDASIIDDTINTNVTEGS